MKHIYLLLVTLDTISTTFSQVVKNESPKPKIVMNKKGVNDIIWFDVNGEPFNLVGFEWLKQDSVFRRLPLYPDWKLSKEVDVLEYHTPGGQLCIIRIVKKRC